MKNMTKTSLSLLLVVCLSIAVVCPSFALNTTSNAGNTANQGATSTSNTSSAADVRAKESAQYEKTETIYASLDASGAAQNIYAINRFEVTKSGAIYDFGTYDSVKNLTSEEALDKRSDYVSFSAGEGVVYYQGNARAKQVQLPWNITISYELDGKSVQAANLAGKSGKLAIHVETSQNAPVDAAFFESYLLQITFTLPGSKVKNISADGATIASAGTDWTVAFSALPNKEASFTLEADVTNFSMDAAQIAAVPYSSIVDMPDTSSFLSEADELVSATEQLNSGTTSLAAGAQELASGARQISSGSASFGEGLEKINMSSASLVSASSQVKDALSKVKTGLDSADMSSLEKIGELSANLRSIAQGLTSLQKSVSAVEEGYTSAQRGLQAAMDTLLAQAPTQAEIEALRASVAADEQSAATVEKLVATYERAQGVKSAWDAALPALTGASEVMKALSASETNEGSLLQMAAALNAMADAIDASIGSDTLSQISQLKSGISTMASEYEKFHEGLCTYTSGIANLAKNYTSLNSGTAELSSGTTELSQGAQELSVGMEEFNSEVSNLPALMQERMDSLMADYDFATFEPVSFISSENTHTQAVQFVMSTPEISEPEQEKVADEQEDTRNVWERFAALFGL